MDKCFILKELNTEDAIRGDLKRIAQCLALKWSLAAKLIESANTEISSHTWPILRRAIHLYTQLTMEYMRGPDRPVRSTARRILIYIIEASDDKTVEALIDDVPYPCVEWLSADISEETLSRLIAVSNAEESYILTRLTLALVKLSGSPDGAWAIGATSFIKYAPKLLDNHHQVCLHASSILRNMALHKVLVLDTELERRLQELAR
ncbi:hypothetical protein R3P38DRAFT_1190174 [Favolaschia claudopus]|uniref:Uncharacterized protein n=1 Tax=Favolaschia claudopus TaxID=2862362 RepID=A0AAW0E1E6_9AGAR